jgi:hypothetical protein
MVFLLFSPSMLHSPTLPQSVRAVVTKVDTEANRLSLSLKPSKLKEADAAEAAAGKGKGAKRRRGADIDEEIAEAAADEDDEEVSDADEGGKSPRLPLLLKLCALQTALRHREDGMVRSHPIPVAPGHPQLRENVSRCQNFSTASALATSTGGCAPGFVVLLRRGWAKNVVNRAR